MELGVRHPSGNSRFQIPLTHPVQYSEKDLPIDPYILGVLIGDGSMVGSVTLFSNPDMDQDIAGFVKEKLPSGYSLSKSTAPSCPQYVIKKPESERRNAFTKAIKSLGLNVHSGEKFIPSAYLLGSVPQRLDLLRGLMDTDGSSAGNRVRFSTSSLRLAKDLVHLVQSLGGTAILRPSYRGKKGTDYSVNVKVQFNPFLCARKSATHRVSEKNPPSRYITAIESDGFEDQVCIKVEAVDSLYLTDDFIVTHNTTLTKHIASQIDGKTVYAAYTGKAAMVMRKNGCDGAMTIHSAMYEVIQDDETGQVSFSFNADGPFSNAGLIAIDECSMVAAPMAEEILSYGRPVLVMGDPEQLPPVVSDRDRQNGTGAGYFTSQRPDTMLTEIHRQAEGNPIIRLASDVRQGHPLRIGQYGNSRVIERQDITADLVMGVDQVLVGRNQTRSAYNTRIREILGRKNHMPAVDDRLVCIKNDKTRGIFNGGIFKVGKTFPAKAGRAANGEISMVLDNLDMPERDPIRVFSRAECFNGKLNDLPWQARRGLQEFDYGYALTVHKAQGSQWDNVLLLDQSQAFGTDHRRWLYTGISRAAQSITVAI